jgi:hypothetical protein
LFAGMMGSYERGGGRGEGEKEVTNCFEAVYERSIMVLTLTSKMYDVVAVGGTRKTVGGRTLVCFLRISTRFTTYLLLPQNNPRDRE